MDGWTLLEHAGGGFRMWLCTQNEAITAKETRHAQDHSTWNLRQGAKWPAFFYIKKEQIKL